MKDALDEKIDLIYTALERAEPTRLLCEWRREPDENVVEAMRRAIKRVDGCLQVTTDALVAAFDAALVASQPRAKAQAKRYRKSQSRTRMSRRTPC